MKYRYHFAPTYQGTAMRPGKTPILNLTPPTGISDSQQRGTLDFLQHLNEQHLLDREHDEELSARIAAYELAFRMKRERKRLEREVKFTKMN